MEIDTALSEIESKYGFTFKEKQLTAIKSIIDNKDTFIVLPTGYGKSKIYEHCKQRSRNCPRYISVTITHDRLSYQT